MVNDSTNFSGYPSYIKFPAILLGLCLFFFILYVLSGIMVPFAMASLFALLLNPISNLLQRRLPRGIAILLTTLAALAVVALLLYFLSHETAAFSNSIPALKAKLFHFTEEAKEFVYDHFGMRIDKQVTTLQQGVTQGELNMSSTLGSIMEIVSYVLLIPVYIYFILFYKPLLLDFIFRLFAEEHSLKVAEILGETKTAIQSYVTGLMLETVIVMTMNSAALLLLGVRSAILIGVLGGLLNLIPYLGGIIAIALPVLMATITKDGYTTQMWIVISYLIIQFIDNNVLVPRVVSSKVQINALFSILVVLLGGALWGVAGMFLSIPFVAVCKIVFDRVDDLKPWGALLGIQIPEKHAGVKWLARWERILGRRVEAARIENNNAAKQRADV